MHDHGTTSDSCYDACLEARVLALSEEFRAKLGWLVGHIYSRVGTQDWPRKAASTLVNQHLNNICQWVDPQHLSAAEKRYKNDSRPPRERPALRDYINATPLELKRDRILKRVEWAIRETYTPAGKPPLQWRSKFALRWRRTQYFRIVRSSPCRRHQPSLLRYPLCQDRVLLWIRGFKHPTSPRRDSAIWGGSMVVRSSWR